MNRFYISHPRPHEEAPRGADAHARTASSRRWPASTSVTKLKRFGVELHTSTVVTERNLPHLLDIYRFLRAHGVDQVVFNVMQANGRANTYFEQIFPSYTRDRRRVPRVRRRASASRERRWRSSSTSRSAPPRASPTSTAATSRSYCHYEPVRGARRACTGIERAGRTSERRGHEAGADPARTISTTRSATSAPSARPAATNAVCEGVWGNYLRALRLGRVRSGRR